MEFNEFLQEVMPKIKKLSELARESTIIDNTFYSKYEVRRGLRDEHGNGVLAGLTDISDIIALIKESQNIPCVIASGTATPQQAAEIAKQADGMIIDSAIVEICEKYGNDCVKYVQEYIQEMKQSISK